MQNVFHVYLSGYSIAVGSMDGSRSRSIGGLGVEQCGMWAWASPCSAPSYRPSTVPAGVMPRARDAVRRESVTVGRSEKKMVVLHPVQHPTRTVQLERWIGYTYFVHLQDDIYKQRLLTMSYPSYPAHFCSAVAGPSLQPSLCSLLMGTCPYLLNIAVSAHPFALSSPAQAPSPSCRHLAAAHTCDSQGYAARGSGGTARARPPGAGCRVS